MDHEPEFHYLSSMKDMETRKYYFDNETEFMATRNFYTNNDLNILYRMHAVSVIAKVTKKDDPDAYVPYLAMNYFDRFICHCDMRHVEGQKDTEKIRLIAISCFTLSAKMRTESFSVEQFLSDLNREMNLSITDGSVMRMEHRIQKTLDWKMQSVTPFCFLNHYYAYFKPLGDFNRRIINEIIVEAQGLYTFAEFRPSEIALCAFANVAKIAYPSKQYPEDCKQLFMRRREKMERCKGLMEGLCRRMNIQIDTPSSAIHSASSKAVTVHQTETKEAGTLKIKEIQQNNIKAVVFANSSEEEEEEGTALIDKRRQNIGKTETSQLQMKEKPEELFDKKDVAAEKTEAEKQSLAKGKGKGKAVEKVKEPQPQMEGSIPETEPKKFMNFELNWETDVASLEVGIGHPETGTDINIGCSSCNIL